MLTIDLHTLALRQLADFDARTPNRMFSEPVDLTIAQAYELQTEVARLRERRGERIIGYKVGCTSAAIQQQLGISEPIFGRLFETGCHFADRAPARSFAGQGAGQHASGVRLSCGDYANPAIEGEYAVRLARNLPGSPLSDQQYEDAIQEIFPVIELHHYVLHGNRPTCQELIASNGMHAGFVVSEGWSTGFSLPAGVDAHQHADPAEIPGLTIIIKSTSDGVIVKSSSLNRPIESLRWLAGRLAEHGLFLREGQIILTGSPMELFPVAPGSQVTVKAESLGESRAEFIE